MLYRPRRIIEETPAENGLHHENLWLTTALGTRIHAWWIPHENPRFTLLFCHGNGGNMGHRIESLHIFHQLGLSTLLFDYSGYGRSRGKPSEAATQADARAAFDWLVNEKGIDPATIILFGRSLGGAIAGKLATEIIQTGATPAAMILESTFPSVPDIGAKIYPWLPVRLLSKYQYNTVKAIAPLTIPALFGHSPQDDVIPYALGRELFESYSGPKTFMEMRGGHNAGFLAMNEEYPRKLDQFLATLPISD